eukprot:scaffold2667_cov237-Amphora_coffeaeformis.AAC.6
MASEVVDENPIPPAAAEVKPKEQDDAVVVVTTTDDDDEDEGEEEEDVVVIEKTVQTTTTTAMVTPAKRRRGEDDNDEEDAFQTVVTPSKAEEEDEDQKPAAAGTRRSRRRCLRKQQDNDNSNKKNGSIAVHEKPYAGMPLYKKFDDGQWYHGRVASETPTPKRTTTNNKNKNNRKGTTVIVNTWKAPRACYDYDTAKKDLCYRMGVTEPEVVAALDQMTPPYGLNQAMRLIHKAKVQAAAAGEVPSREKFTPGVGLRIRKAYHGSLYHGTVTKDAEMLEVDGQMTRMWEVTFDDGEKEDMDFEELMACWAGRSTRTNPIRGRQLCFLELFSGCGAVTQEFAERKWRVRSIDNDDRSFATDRVDIMKLQYLDMGMVPDVIWASPPCFTYSNLAGGKHRASEEGQYEKTPEAHENNRYFTRMASIMRWAKGLNPHLMVIIENPQGLLSKMPLMQQLMSELGLYQVTVHYCAFGREDMKPTQLWTNDFKLRSTLSEYICSNKCPYHGGIHPIGARGNGTLYNAASIPQALAEEVAEHATATFYDMRIRHTKEHKLTEEEQEAFNKLMSDAK